MFAENMNQINLLEMSVKAKEKFFRQEQKKLKADKEQFTKEVQGFYQPKKKGK